VCFRDRVGGHPPRSLHRGWCQYSCGSGLHCHCSVAPTSLSPQAYYVDRVGWGYGAIALHCKHVTACSRRCTGHASRCEGKVVSTALGRGCALRTGCGACPNSAPLPIAVALVAVAANVATVTAVPHGRDRPVAWDNEVGGCGWWRQDRVQCLLLPWVQHPQPAVAAVYEPEPLEARIERFSEPWHRSGVLPCMLVCRVELESMLHPKWIVIGSSGPSQAPRKRESRIENRKHVSTHQRQVPSLQQGQARGAVPSRPPSDEGPRTPKGLAAEPHSVLAAT
jgi:hypothetical protein